MIWKWFKRKKATPKIVVDNGDGWLFEIPEDKKVDFEADPPKATSCFIVHPIWATPVGKVSVTSNSKGIFLHHLYIDGELVETKESEDGRSVQFDHLFSCSSSNRIRVDIVPKNPPTELSWGDIEVKP